MKAAKFFQTSGRSKRKSAGNARNSGGGVETGERLGDVGWFTWELLLMLFWNPSTNYTVVKVDGATPKGGLARGHDKPIHGSCAIYFPGGI